MYRYRSVSHCPSNLHHQNEHELDTADSTSFCEHAAADVQMHCIYATVWEITIGTMWMDTIMTMKFLVTSTASTCKCVLIYRYLATAWLYKTKLCSYRPSARVNRTLNSFGQKCFPILCLFCMRPMHWQVLAVRRGCCRPKYEDAVLQVHIQRIP